MPVKDRVIFVPRGPRGLTGAVGPTGEPSVETARIDEILDVDPGNNSVFVDAINGNDANSGGSVSSSVATFPKAVELCRCFGFNYIYLLSDIVLEHRIPIDHFSGLLFIRGRNGDNSSAQNRKVTVTDAINNINRPGNFAINCNMALRVENVDFELATSRGFGVFEVSVAYLQAFLQNVSLTRVGGGAANLLHTGFGSISCRFSNLTLNPGADGYLFSDISPGVDPNSVYNISSNINAA